MPRSILGRLLTCTALMASLGAQAEIRYRIQDLSPIFPGSFNVFVTAINNAGWITGEAYDHRVFLFKEGAVQFLPSLDGNALEQPRAINNRGDLTGNVFSLRGDKGPYLYTAAGRLVDLTASVSDDVRAGAKDINNAGLVLGDMVGGQEVFLSDGTNVRLVPAPSTVVSVHAAGLNDRGVVVGTATVSGAIGHWAFMLAGSEYSLLPRLPDGRILTEAVDINNAGDVIGTALRDSFQDDAYVLRDGRYHAVGLPGALDSFAGDINERGWVVGQSQVEGASEARAFLYRNGRSLDLTSLLAPADAGRWWLQSASGINDRGQIIGEGFINGELHAFIATPVPEAGTWALMLAGLGVVGTVARARRAGRGRRTEPRRPPPCGSSVLGRRAPLGT